MVRANAGRVTPAPVTASQLNRRLNGRLTFPLPEP